MSESERSPDNLPVSFVSFLVSLGSSALVHLGEIGRASCRERV